MAAKGDAAASIRTCSQTCSEVDDEDPRSTEVEDDDLRSSEDDLLGMTEAERAAEVESLRRKALEEARQLEQSALEEAAPAAAQQKARHARWHRGRARIVDFDPKQRGAYYN
ncbi:hypothetical protein ACP70R_043908 [Stipagrostis hirtigluma subsp. patula]